MLRNLFRNGFKGNPFNPKSGWSRLYADASGLLRIISNVDGTVADQSVNPLAISSTDLSGSTSFDAPTALVTATAKDIATVALTPGTWLIGGHVHFHQTGATCTVRRVGLNVTTDTLPGNATIICNDLPTTTTTGVIGVQMPLRKIAIQANQTWRLVASATFSAGTVTGSGIVVAYKIAD